MATRQVKKAKITAQGGELAVVIPCYKETARILDVISSIGKEVARI